MRKKYNLEPVKYCGKTAYRLVAVRDFGDVKAGNRGGIVFGPKCLSHEGLCWIDSTVVVKKHARVCGDSILKGDVTIKGHSIVSGSSIIEGGPVVIMGHSVIEDSIVKGDTVINNCNVCDSTIENAVMRNCYCSDSTITNSDEIEDGMILSSAISNVASSYRGRFTDASVVGPVSFGDGAMVNGGKVDMTHTNYGAPVIMPSGIILGKEAEITDRNSVFVFYTPADNDPFVYTAYRGRENRIYITNVGLMLSGMSILLDHYIMADKDVVIPLVKQAFGET